MDRNWSPIYKKAVLIKEITGNQFSPIPVGTIFEVVTNMVYSTEYSTCRGLKVNQVWNDEFKIIED